MPRAPKGQRERPTNMRTARRWTGGPSRAWPPLGGEGGEAVPAGLIGGACTRMSKPGDARSVLHDGERDPAHDCLVDLDLPLVAARRKRQSGDVDRERGV